MAIVADTPYPELEWPIKNAPSCTDLERRVINIDLKMKLVRSLVWTVLTYGDGWTLAKADEKRIESAEMWIYCRLLRVSWTEHRTDESILLELNTTRQLLGFVVRRKLSYLGHTMRDGGCELVKCVIQGKVNGKRRRGRPNTSYSSNITKWIMKAWSKYRGTHEIAMDGED